MDPLSAFHPLTRAWFAATYGAPTDIQARAWPLIASGAHVLLTAPTGSGKTLTAFLWALDRFASGAWEPGSTRILYVSPLKALNSDIARNLSAPLEGLRRRFGAEGRPFPEVRIQVRSGDTPAPERRRMLRQPPEILVTTPESLNLLLLSGAGREALREVRTVILDEVHAVAGAKRGVHLITAVDRLVPLAGEFQRIALTATVRPLEAVAEWAGGYRMEAEGYVPRKVAIAVSRAEKRYDLRVRFPSSADRDPGDAPDPPGGPSGSGSLPAEAGPDRRAAQAGSEGAQEPPDGIGGSGPDKQDIWSSIAGEIKRDLAGARSTLVFANNRRLTERLARLLNEGEEKPVAYAHHGSLSREIRGLIEERMQQGRLPAIVATNSLELGIDIGSIDRVILVETPFSVASTLQKIGRAGHGVGQVSRAVLYASHGKDLIDAAVAARCALAGDLEETRPPEGPLDLLAQLLLALAVSGESGQSGEWTADRMYAFVRTSHPYRHLRRRLFDAALEMLAGRYQSTRVRELRPRLFVDAVDGRVTAAKGTALLLGLSGGTIPDRGLFALRHAATGAKIGELDEEFVWERRVGESFHLGAQSWRITAIGANDVEAVPAERQAQLAPFWRADERDRGFHFAARRAGFLESADAALDDPALAAKLQDEHGLEPAAAEALIGFLRRQREATGAPLPHRRHLLIEDAGEAEGSGGTGAGAGRDGDGGGGERKVILHATWGGTLLRPFAYALAEAYEERYGYPLEILAGDDSVWLQPDAGIEAGDLLDLVRPDNLEDLLRRRLEKTGFFAAHFRQNAARALLLPRSTPRSRVPLWINRLRSRALLQAVAGFPDFPVVLETWRECLDDAFDLPALKSMLAEVQAGAIRVSRVRTRAPSPFAGDLVWKRTNQWMYAGDAPVGGAGEAAGILREAAFSAPLRPRIPRAIIREFEEKALRLAPGYGPQTAEEWVEWAKERILIPWDEWRFPASAETSHVRARLLGVRLPGASLAGVAAVETLPGLLAALGWAPDGSAGPTGPDAPPDAAAGPGSRTPTAGIVLFDPFAAPTVTHGLPRDGADPEALRHFDRLARAMSGSSRPVDSGLEGTTPDEASPDGEGAAPSLAALLAQWLRPYGPRPASFPEATFGAAGGRVAEALADLAEGDRIISDVLGEDAAGPEICDAANVEILLRLMRRRARPAFAPRPAGHLPPFLAAWQGATGPSRGTEALQAALEKLFGLPAPAAAWEADILPARVEAYSPGALDELMRESGLSWYGHGPGRIAFAFPEDRDLFPPPPPEAGDPPGSDAAHVLEILQAASPGRLDYSALAARCPLPSDRMVAALWDLVWRGAIANDSFAALRKGIETGFRAAPPEGRGQRGDGHRATGRRASFGRWKASRPLTGSWMALPPPAPPGDALAAEELAQDRARQLLRRYGILFRELLAHEAPELQWGRVFRSLRLLELAGEAVAGHFFEGVSGLQFLSPAALRLLEGGPPESVWWLSAADPASPAGLGLQGLPYALPPRLASTHLVFHGPEPVLISRRLGRDLEIRVPPRQRYLGGYLGCLRSIADRAAGPAKGIETETVNGEPVMGSPYLEDLLEAGFEKGFRTAVLRRRW